MKNNMNQTKRDLRDQYSNTPLEEFKEIISNYDNYNGCKLVELDSLSSIEKED